MKTRVPTPLPRSGYIEQLHTALSRSPVVALLGPRQCGKTTLARMIADGRSTDYFDLGSQADLRRLENPEYVLGRASGLVVIDEIQIRSDLFDVLRVLADRPGHPARFLILGSAAPDLMKGASESLAGRVEFVDLQGFDLTETGISSWERLWIRGAFPRSFLADSDVDSAAWREGIVRSYLQRDIPELGIRIPAAAVRRFWSLLANHHARLWNASELAGAMGLSDKTVRSYLDILTDTFMVRQLQPWHENVAKRQIKSPKIYFRDTGLLHALLELPDHDAVLRHSAAGLSWEGFVIEQITRISRLPNCYFWATQGGAELDLLFMWRGCRYGVEAKFSDAPRITRSMRSAFETLKLDRLWIVGPVKTRCELDSGIESCPLALWPEVWREFLDNAAAR
jgi:predicted AAA+ superfamily ATPase